MKKITHAVLITISTFVFVSLAHATNIDVTKLRTSFAGQLTIKTAMPGPSGLIELVTEDNSIFYTNEDGSILIQGQIFDTTTKKNLTDERSQEINRIDISKLPLQHSIKIVKGNGARQIYLFEDPNCGYCKALFKRTLNDMTDLTLHIFQYNILSPESEKISRNVWCAKEPSAALLNWMERGDVVPESDTTCTAPHKEIVELGSKLKLRGVPTLVFADGSRVPGLMDKASLENKLNAIHGSK